MRMRARPEASSSKVLEENEKENKLLFLQEDQKQQEGMRSSHLIVYIYPV